MKRSAFTLALVTALLALPCLAAPKGKKRQQPPVAATTPAPSTTPAKPATPEPKPISEELPPAWHTWSDAQGRQVEASFCALANDVVTVQTRDGQTYRLNLHA